MAIRVPKGFGLEAGTEVILREQNGKLEVLRAPAESEWDKIIGSAPDMKPVRPEDRPLLTQPRAWDEPDDC